MFDFFKKSKTKNFVEEPATAVFTTKFVINENKTITYVTHDIDDGAWQFFSEDDFDSFEEVAMIVTLEQIIERDKSLLEISDLPLGCVATRKDQNDTWKISKQRDKYKYRFRPEYNSENLLIEIFSGVENENFLSDLLNSIVEINPKIEEIKNLWMNDEFMFEVHSDIGNFLLSKDIWDLAFLMSENNQECLHRIDLILSKDKRFEKIEANFNDYK